jgi:ABC-type sugar transport system permease subunit
MVSPDPSTPAPDANPPSPLGPRRSSLGWLSEFQWAPYLFLIPTVGLLFVFSVLPMIYGVWMSLQNVDVVRGTSSFIGLNNYLRLFHDGQFGLSRPKYRLVHLDGGSTDRYWQYRNCRVFTGKQAGAANSTRWFLHSVCLVTGGGCHLLEMVAE